MGLLRHAMGDGVQPLHDALLEKVGSVGVVVGARGVNEHVALSGVSVNVRLGGMAEQRRDVGCRNPVVGIRDVYGEPYVVAPIATDFFWRHCATHQHTVVDTAPLLGQQLGRKGSEREPHDRVGGGVVERCTASDVLDCVVADATRVRESIVESRKHLARKHVGSMDCVASGAEAIDKAAQALREALRVMEK